MDHDRLFKELLTTFFVEFLEPFFPEVLQHFDQDSIEFLDKETFTDVTTGDRHQVDLLVKVRFREAPTCFLIHTETQAQPEADFGKRMFKYFARLYEKFDLPVYPVALFSFDEPQRAEPDLYRVTFPDLDVITFRFRVVQLNRLDWRDFVERMNPVAAALMAKMHREALERPGLKLACLQLLGRLQLDPARRAMISSFIDSYLQLTMEEEQQFAAQLSQIEPEHQEQVMEIVTSWMKKGLEQGRQEGRQEGMREEARDLVLRQLRKRLGAVDSETVARIGELSVDRLEQLAEALLDFASPTDLSSWLAS